RVGEERAKAPRLETCERVAALGLSLQAGKKVRAQTGKRLRVEEPLDHHAAVALQRGDDVGRSVVVGKPGQLTHFDASRCEGPRSDATNLRAGRRRPSPWAPLIGLRVLDRKS